MKKVMLILLGSLMFLMGCSSNGEMTEEQRDKEVEAVSEDGAEKLSVYTSIYPLYYIAEEVGGDHIELQSIVPEGTDPHDFEPSLRTVGEARDGDVLIYNGAGLETWAEGLSAEMDQKRVLIASDFVELLSIDDNDAHNHDHSHDHHGDKDPHIWLSPINMKKLAKAVELKFSELDPENSESYKTNSKALIQKLETLDESYRSELEQKTSNKILVSHKAFGYLANEYGIEQLAVASISPQSEPTPRTITDLLDIAEREELKYIYFEVLASPRSVQMIADEANLETLTLNPVEGLTPENVKSGEDYITLMEENLENIKKELLK